MYCPCRRIISCTTALPPYRIVTYNDKGEVIYAVCIHGDVVINKDTGEENELD